LLVGAGIGAIVFLDARQAGIVSVKQAEAIRTHAEETRTHLDAAKVALRQFEVVKAHEALAKASRSLTLALEIRIESESKTGLESLSAEIKVLEARVIVASSNEADEPALSVLQSAFLSGDLESGRWALDHATRLVGETEWADSLPDPTGIPEEDGPRAELLLELRVALDRRQGRPRSWEALLTRSSKTPLGRAARLHEARWLIEREHFEEARQVLWAADQQGEVAPLLHARLLRAVQRDDPQTYSLQGLPQEGWEALHARLVDQARGRVAVHVDLATAELAILRGELRRARAVLAPWLGERLAAGIWSEVRALDLTALSLQDEARARADAQKLIRQPGLSPRARARLAWLAPDAVVGADLPEEALLAGLADRIDSALGQLVLRSLGGALKSKALVELASSDTSPTLPGTLKTFGPADPRAQHLGLRARVALIHLSAGHETSARALLEEEGLPPAVLAHPELSLARRLLLKTPLELPVAPWWAPPPGLVLGRRWTARYEAMLQNDEDAERAFKRAKAALHLAIRHAPTDPHVRLARARLRLLRAAHARIDGQRAREGALRDATLAVAIAPDLTSAWRTFFYAAWALDEAALPQILARAQGDYHREALHPADRLTLQLLSGEGIPLGSPWYGSLAQSRRELLRRSSGSEERQSQIHPVPDLLEALAAAGQAAGRAPIEGELLLRDPTWLAEHLAGRCRTKTGCSLDDAEALKWAAAQDKNSGPLANAARTVLLVRAIRGSGRAGRGQGWLEALWRDHGGPGCLRLEVAWVLWTRPAGQRVLLADLEPLPGKDDALAHLLAALIAKSGKPREALTAELWSAPLVKRWH
ncbi:MAG: hypothetical protein JKY65_26115, partial [Planctomycetes bacterium]|nr:hypothetical protein [Planctomycetota bacterium]